MHERANTNNIVETATLGGGCFWCLDAVYRRVRGVLLVTSGYAGGETKNPTYEQVCSGTTGHAEVVQVEFDPGVISYSKILDIFFSIHDPTQINRQGNDVGTQYRSIIFSNTPKQKDIADKTIQYLTQSGVFNNVTTEVLPLNRFYPAEEYHQDYFAKNPGNGYCHVVISPKVAKFTKRFPELLE